MTQSYETYSSLRNMMWGVKGEKLFLKLQGKKPSENLAQIMRRMERAGFCQSYGCVPVHTVINIVIPAAFSLAAREIGLPDIPWMVWFSAALSAIGSSFLPINRKAIRKVGGIILIYVEGSLKFMRQAY